MKEIEFKVWDKRNKKWVEAGQGLLGYLYPSPSIIKGLYHDYKRGKNEQVDVIVSPAKSG